MNVSMFGLSARMAAGKTSVSKGVAEAIYAKRISFGGVVREEAQKQSVPFTREALQDLGQSLVQEDVGKFCQRVLAEAGWTPGDSIVVDGVRHVAVLDTLRQIVQPKYFALLYLSVDRDTQRERWKSEDLTYTKSLEELEAHPTEIEVLQKLPEHADLVLDGKHSVPHIVKDVIRWSKSKSILGKDWDARNERRLELCQKAARDLLTQEEREEFELLQSSFAQYLAVRFDPYQTTDNTHQQRYLELAARLRSSAKQ